MNELTIVQGSVGTIGGQRIGVRWVWDDDFIGSNGKKAHGMAAGLTLSPPERKETVGRGSVIDVGGRKYEVTSVIGGAKGSVMLRELSK